MTLEKVMHTVCVRIAEIMGKKLTGKISFEIDLASGSIVQVRVKHTEDLTSSIKSVNEV